MCLPVEVLSADARLSLLRADLMQFADALADIDVCELTAGSLGETVADLMRVRRQLEGSIAAIAGRFSSSGEWSSDGARDALAWLRDRGGEGFGAARQVLSTASESSQFPAMGQALRRGEISMRHVHMLGEVARRFPRLRTHLRDAEAHVVDLARACEPARFRRELHALCFRLDPRGARDDERDQDRGFYFRASTLMDGHVRVDGMLPPEVGQLLISALESSRRLVASETDSEMDPHGEPGGGKPAVDVDGSGEGRDVFGQPVPVVDPIDDRRRGQRNVEALQRILVLVTGPDAGLASVAGQRPQVNVTVSAESLSADPDSPVPCGWLERFGVPTEPVAIDTARRLACDATLRPLIVDANGDLVAFGSASRVIPPSMRALVVRRDRHCRFAGCHSRIDEVHHIVFYSRGGLTRSDNLLGLCWYHHHLVHEGGWQIHGDANVEVKGIGPTGRCWVTGPPPLLSG